MPVPLSYIPAEIGTVSGNTYVSDKGNTQLNVHSVSYFPVRIIDTKVPKMSDMVDGLVFETLHTDLHIQNA